MVMNTVSYSDLGDVPVPGLRPDKEMKQAFARKLYQLNLKKGWNQSDLAREASNAAERGETVSRDNVSTYMRAASLPTEPKLKALAKALGVEPRDLLPTFIPAADGPRFGFADEIPPFEMTVDKDGGAIVRMNRRVSIETATKIASLLGEDVSTNDNVPHAKRRR